MPVCFKVPSKHPYLMSSQWAWYFNVLNHPLIKRNTIPLFTGVKLGAASSFQGPIQLCLPALLSQPGCWRNCPQTRVAVHGLPAGLDLPSTYLLWSSCHTPPLFPVPRRRKSLAALPPDIHAVPTTAQNALFLLLGATDSLPGRRILAPDLSGLT